MTRLENAAPKPRKKVKEAPVRGVARKARVRRSNPARKAREFARAYGSKERVAWVQGQLCAACGWAGGCENAHVPSRSGAGRKGDYRKIAALCGARPMTGGAMITRDGKYDIGCHAALHDLGKQRFEKAYSVDLDAIASSTEIAWQSHIAERTA